MGLVVLKNEDHERYQQMIAQAEPKLEVVQSTPKTNQPKCSQIKRAIWSTLRLAGIVSILFVTFLVTYAKIGLTSP
ncbi:MAG: hypothetical protein GX589_03470 [Deltaproteobacteria bacterium]|nr:hypothetical protein [Deltaproteobacteria bacterium]